jgi:hypothetical protein
LPNGSITNDLKGILMLNSTTFGEDNNVELYVATFDEIYKISACGNEQNLTLNSPISTSGNYSALNYIQSKIHCFRILKSNSKPSKMLSPESFLSKPVMISIS